MLERPTSGRIFMFPRGEATISDTGDDDDVLVFEDEKDKPAFPRKFEDIVVSKKCQITRYGSRGEPLSVKNRNNAVFSVQEKVDRQRYKNAVLA